MQRREDAYERAYLAWRTDERGWNSGSEAGRGGTRGVVLSRSSQAVKP